MSWYLITQSISRPIRSRSPVDTALSVRSHRSRILSTAPVRSPRFSAKSRALVKYSSWISSALISRPLARRTFFCPVMSWLTSRIARIGFSRVMSRSVVPASIMRSTRSVAPTLSIIVVSDMLESPTITCRRRYFSASACGSSRVLMIGRDRVVAEETPSQMCSARCETQYTAPRGVGQHLAGPADQLPGDQERDQHVGQPGELAVPAHQVVLVAAVGVAGRVGVVLEQVDVAGDALFVQAPLGVGEQPLQDPLAGLVVDDQLAHGVALGGGVLRVRADVQVQAARRCAGRRCWSAPRTRRGGRGSARPRPGTGDADRGTCR